MLFFQEGDDEVVNVFFLLSSLAIAVLVLLVICVCRLFIYYSERDEYTLLDSDDFRDDVPREFLNDEESLTQLAETFDFTSLSPEEQGAYLRGQEFTRSNPHDVGHTRGRSYTQQTEEIIKDCGITAFHFENDDTDVLTPRFVVADKTEVHFNNNDLPYSTATATLNYSLPVRNRLYSDTVYFETKIYDYNNTNNPNAHFSIGLVTKPYPSAFRLPGYNNFSIGYESTGNLKINKPFPTPLQQHQGEQSEYNALVLPPLEQADVVGFGYVVSTGTLFITRNGKKLLDVMKGCFVDMYPAIGCFSTNAKFQINIGQLGFVWVEANVRKYGFVSRSDYKKIKGERGLAALPQYGSVIEEGSDGDKILDRGEELPPRYPEEELDFFGRSAKDIVREGSSSKQVAQDSEKDVDEKEDEEEPKDHNHSSSQVTNETEEEMNLRERRYEQSTHEVIEGTPVSAEELTVAESVNAEGETETAAANENSNEESSVTASSKDATPEVESKDGSPAPGTSKAKKGSKKKKKAGKKGKKKGKK